MKVPGLGSHAQTQDASKAEPPPTGSDTSASPTYYVHYRDSAGRKNDPVSFASTEAAEEKATYLREMGQLDVRVEAIHTVEPASRMPKFPREAMIGPLADLADELSRGNETLSHFNYMTAATIYGSACGNRLVFESRNTQPRLYTSLIGESDSVKKSTSHDLVVEQFRTAGLLFETGTPGGYLGAARVNGIGSGEGFARVLKDHPVVLLQIDELATIFQKFEIKSSTLLPMLTSLFERNIWQNELRDTRKSFNIQEAYVSMIAACTIATFGRLFGLANALAIGFLNRLTLVYGEKEKDVALPSAPDNYALSRIGADIARSFPRQMRVIGITADAREEWMEFYRSIPRISYAKRVDTIGWRFMTVLAATTGRPQVDMEIIRPAIAFASHQLEIRRLLEPPESEHKVGAYEQKVRRALKGGQWWLSLRSLIQQTNAYRDGVYFLLRALENLEEAREIAKQELDGMPHFRSLS